jgi:hypothetical protein
VAMVSVGAQLELGFPKSEQRLQNDGELRNSAKELVTKVAAIASYLLGQQILDHRRQPPDGLQKGYGVTLVRDRTGGIQIINTHNINSGFGLLCGA